jgi:glycosyltransferase involved in cell wall biosynthesis
MRVYVTPPSNMSRAMFRVARALRRYAPKDIEVVDDIRDADTQILHVIGRDVLTYDSRAENVAVIQYCTDGCRTQLEEWAFLWQRSLAVWSYYDLRSLMPSDANFYYAPLGIDSAFRSDYDRDAKRDIGVVTSGYVNGSCAEAIEEVAHAASRAGLKTVHIGPIPINLTRELPNTFSNAFNISDFQLASIYRRAQFVSGLRHVEGFEMPAIEGLACGARPIVFEREDMRSWYDDCAMFVYEDASLETNLEAIFKQGAAVVTPAERESALRRFDWQRIIDGFWQSVLTRIEATR